MHCKFCLISGGFGVLLLPRTLNHAGRISLAVRKEGAAGQAGQVTSGEQKRQFWADATQILNTLQSENDHNHNINDDLVLPYLVNYSVLFAFVEIFVKFNRVY